MRIEQTKTLDESIGTIPDRCKRRTVDHWLFFNKESDAEPAVAALRAEHFSVDSMEETDTIWLVLASKRMAATPDEIAATSDMLKSLASLHHGRYG